MKKRVYTVILAISLLCASVVGCGNSESKKDSSKETVEEKKETKQKEDTSKEENKETVKEEEKTATDEDKTDEKSTDASSETTTDANADWKTLAFTLDGKQVTFPISYAAVKEMGFALDSEYETEEIEGMHYTTGLNVKNSTGETMVVRFKNFTNDTKTVADSDIYGFRIERLVYTDNNPTFTFCNGITFGDNADKIKSLMGEPTSENGNDDGTRVSLEYEVSSDDAYDRNGITFTLHDGELDCVEIINSDM